MNFKLLIQEMELVDLLTPEYAKLAVAVKEGLALFLSGLPEDIQDYIVREQLKLGQPNTVSQRLGCLARCSPVLHKLGQVLARNQQLAPALRLELQKLEWLPPSFSRADIEAELNHEIGPLEAHNITLAPHALAEASVAVVIPFARKDSRKINESPAFNGVIKMLKPGIEDRLQLEFKLLQQVGELLDDECQNLDIPELEYGKFFAQVIEVLQQEILLEQEQQNLQAAAACYVNQPLIKIPRLLQPCSSRVTAMERIMGNKLEAATIVSATQRMRLADLVVTGLLVQPIFSSAEHSLFHGDPHAGNLFCTNDGRLALLDWSQAGHLDLSQRRLLSRIMLAASTLRPEKIVTMIAEMAYGPIPDSAGLRRAIEKSLQSIRSGRFPGFSWLVSLFDSVVLEARIQFPANVLLFRKALLTVAGIVEELSGDRERADTVVMHEFMRIFAAEWPWRWQFLPSGTDRTSHLSNADLLDATMATFTHPSQFFAEYWLSLFTHHTEP